MLKIRVPGRAERTLEFGFYEFGLYEFGVYEFRVSKVQVQVKLEGKNTFLGQTILCGQGHADCTCNALEFF